MVTRKAVDETKNFETSVWGKNENGQVFRIQKYQFVKTLMMTRNIINVQQTQTRSVTIPGRMYIVDAITENSGIMYADYFRVPIHWRFIREDLHLGNKTLKENKKKTRLQIVADIEWVKACIMKGKIEGETHSNIKKYYEVVEKELRNKEVTSGRITTSADTIGDTHSNIQDRRHGVRKVPDQNQNNINNNSGPARYTQEDIDILMQRFHYRENLLTLAVILLLTMMVFATLGMFKLYSTMSLMHERMTQIELANMHQSRHQDEFLKTLKVQAQKYNVY